MENSTSPAYTLPRIPVTPETLKPGKTYYISFQRKDQMRNTRGVPHIVYEEGVFDPEYKAKYIGLVESDIKYGRRKAPLMVHKFIPEDTSLSLIIHVRPGIWEEGHVVITKEEEPLNRRGHLLAAYRGPGTNAPPFVKLGTNTTIKTPTTSPSITTRSGRTIKKPTMGGRRRTKRRLTKGRRTRRV